MNLLSLQRWVGLAGLCLLAAACSRGPQTAAELKERLPKQFRGELTMQGEAAPRRTVLEPHDFIVRTVHVLEFRGVRYQLLAGGNVLAEGDAEMEGTISTPDLAITVDSVGGVAAAALKAGTFRGSFSADLQSVEAAWSSGEGQGVTLKARAGK